MERFKNFDIDTLIDIAIRVMLVGTTLFYLGKVLLPFFVTSFTSSNDDAVVLLAASVSSLLVLTKDYIIIKKRIKAEDN